MLLLHLTMLLLLLTTLLLPLTQGETCLSRQDVLDIVKEMETKMAEMETKLSKKDAEIEDLKAKMEGKVDIAALPGAVVPHGVHCLVLRQVLGQVVSGSGDDVDHPARQVAGLEHLVEVEGEEGELLAGHHHHRV